MPFLRKAFGIKGKINIQIYNAEWQEFIDRDPDAYDKVEDRSKLPVIILKVSFIIHVTYGIWINRLNTQQDFHIQYAYTVVIVLYWSIIRNF